MRDDLDEIDRRVLKPMEERLERHSNDMLWLALPLAAAMVFFAIVACA